MRNKKIFSFDEKKDAEEVLSKGFPNGIIDYSKMYLIAKYFRKTYNIGAIRIERELIRFCKAQDENFNPIVESESIKRWVKSAMKYGLRKIDSISISQKEIDFLKTIETPKDRKLLFATLILSKAMKRKSTKDDKSGLKVSDNYYIRYDNFLDIIRLSKTSNVTEIELANIFHKYKQYFTFYKPTKELIRLEFIDKHPEEPIILDNLSKIPDYYELFFGKPKSIDRCTICHTPIIKRSNRQITCANCSKLLEKERKARWRVKHQIPQKTS